MPPWPGRQLIYASLCLDHKISMRRLRNTYSAGMHGQKIISEIQ
jgi:hypothetical protein